jgi:ribosomal protein L11 methyltransferase
MLALVVSVTAAEAEVVADLLWTLGVVAIEERTSTGSADNDSTVELWTSLGDDRSAIDLVMSAHAARCSWRFVEVDESVADAWRAHARPTWIEDDLVVLPAWLAPEFQLPDASPSEVIVIAIDPGATFGAGDHPTTVLSLRALARLLRPRSAPAAVLDVGCGSGVLAVAAIRLGASSADAIDISPASVAITVENARLNGVSSAVRVSTTPLAAMSGTYDVVVANILAPVLIELAADLQRVLAPDGVLVISGVLADRFDHVVAALAPLAVAQIDELDGWAAITLRR